MITNTDLDNLCWHKRSTGEWAFKKDPYFYLLYPPTENETRHFFKIAQGVNTMYVGNIPDKAAMICLMRWLEFPAYWGNDPWLIDYKGGNS